jgi:Bacterial regulatory helix-turn-helix protein, lysR family
MTKSLDLKRDDPRSHPFDTTAPSISRRALDHADLLSGDYWGELRIFLWVAKAGSLSKAAELLGSSHATVGREIRRLQDQMGLSARGSDQERRAVHAEGARANR